MLEELRRLGLFGSEDAAASLLDPAEIEHQRAAEERRRQRRIAEALDFWRYETMPPDGTAVIRYWHSRGLSLPIPPSIRASRSWLRHPEGGTRPCMIALVKHEDFGPVAIHRTWLTIDGSGKASFKTPRLALGPVGGGAVRLAPASVGEPLIVAEGVETAAAVATATGLPAWAALSAIGIERLVLPSLPLTPVIIIAADNDRNGVGIHAAKTAADRWIREGRRLRIALPPVPGTDWNDVLQGKDR